MCSHVLAGARPPAACWRHCWRVMRANWRGSAPQATGMCTTASSPLSQEHIVLECQTTIRPFIVALFGADASTAAVQACAVRLAALTSADGWSSTKRVRSRLEGSPSSSGLTALVNGRRFSRMAGWATARVCSRGQDGPHGASGRCWRPNPRFPVHRRLQCVSIASSALTRNVEWSEGCPRCRASFARTLSLGRCAKRHMQLDGSIRKSLRCRLLRY